MCINIVYIVSYLLNSQINQLQHIQNSLDLAVIEVPKFSHIIIVLRSSSA